MSVMLQRIWIQVTGDRRRFVVLCAAALIGLLLWSRIILISNIPRTAVAEEAGDSQVAGGGLTGTATIVNNPKPTLRITLPRTPQRDPFAPPSSYLPNSLQMLQNVQDTGKSGPNSADLTGVAAADLTAMLKSEAARYKLEALMPGQDLAVINGHVYRAGMKIELPDTKNPLALSFKLAEVKPRSVVIDHEGHTFELTLEPPKIKQQPPELKPKAGTTQPG